jgi:site-specific DNA-cytosine methylase
MPVVQAINGDKAGTLDASYYKGCGERSGVEREVVAMAVDARNATEDEVNGALQSNAAHSLNGNNVVRHRYIVRRLTPLECERLQGYPDGWTDIGEWTDSNGKKRQTSDAARYKALGNSIALPPWKWVLKRLCACYERDATMASLFDGIGGFPYLWEQLNGKGSCLWASEIEEFPMAVTKVRIGE